MLKSIIAKTAVNFVVCFCTSRAPLLTGVLTHLAKRTDHSGSGATCHFLTHVIKDGQAVQAKIGRAGMIEHALAKVR